MKSMARAVIIVFLGWLLVSSVAGAQSAPIKIGAVTALSAPGAVETGEALLAGMKVAIEEINATGGVLGRPVELVVGDTAGLPEKGTAVMERLISKDKVVAVGGELHSSVALAEIEVAHRYGVPIVISEAWSDTITAKQYPEVFRLTVANSLVYAIAADWAKEAGFKHVAVIAENSDWGLGVLKVFQENLSKAGIKVTTFNADHSTPDFTPQLLTLKRMNPKVDLIIDGFTGTSELLMIKQAYELGLAPSKNTAIFGAGMDVLYPGFWDTVGAGGKFVLANPAGLPGLPKTPVSERFVEKFKKRYDREPDSVAMEGFDSVYVLAEAIRAAGSTDGKAIIEGLENLEWLGTRGTVRFTTDRSPDWIYHLWPEVPVFVIQYSQANQAPSDAAILWPKRHATIDQLILKP